MLMSGGTDFRPVTRACWDTAARLEDLDAAGIDMQLISATPILFQWERPPQVGSQVDGSCQGSRAGDSHATGQKHRPCLRQQLRLLRVHRRRLVLEALVLHVLAIRDLARASSRVLDQC